MKRHLYILFCILPILGFSQLKTIGTPNISNYKRSEYNAGTQNWGICQDEHGFMYFANNDGVLIFDGLNWDLIEVSKSSAVRSVCAGKNNKIYVGLFNDFGVLENDESGKLFYKSLRNLIPSNINDIDNVWKIYDTRYGIVFQSYNYLFILQDGEIRNIKPKRNYHFSFYVNNRLLLHEPGVGLFEFINGFVYEVPWADQLKDTEILSILQLSDNHMLLGTARNGVYEYIRGRLRKWNTPVNQFVETNKLFSATMLFGNHIAFGTILDGIVISDYDGEIVQQINQKLGLQNSTILSLFTDKDENLWLGLDNGIDYIEVNSPLSFISDNEGISTGYCCEVFQNKLYLGTNQGLFVRPFNTFSNNNKDFKLVENSEGQVWSLDVFDGQLICGHNLGTFVVNNETATNVCDEPGAWKYIRLHNRDQFLLGGHYNGLVLLKKESNGWQFNKSIKGFNESCRFIHQDYDGSIWVSHGGKGIFKVTLNEALDSVINYKLYTSADGLPSNERNILFVYNNENYISTIKGIYKYQSSTDSFVVSDKMNRLFNLNDRLKIVQTDNTGNVWYIAQNESGVFRRNEDLTYTKISTPFKPLEGKFVNEFEFIYPLNNDHVFIGIDDGFAHYSSKLPKSYSQPFQSFITKVELPYLDSILYLSYLNSDAEFNFPFKSNSFRFNYAAPFFENRTHLEFSFFIENYSENWSEWTSDNYKDFTNLPEGKYTFRLKAKNIYGIESEISAFAFVIDPPWHRSRIAYYFYILLFIIFCFLLIKFILHRIKLSNRKVKIRHRAEFQKKEELFQHQAVVTEKEIIKLRNDKLRAEKVHRDKELANQTMSIIQKNKFLVKLNQELQRIQSATEDSSLKTKLVILKKRIDKEIDNKQQNKIFETYFDEVHNDFFQRLKSKYPQLSPKDLRLCAYMRMNISTKELSTLLNITDRGVEISRYRLRKKMELTRDVNLPTFLSNI